MDFNKTVRTRLVSYCAGMWITFLPENTAGVTPPRVACAVFNEAPVRAALASGALLSCLFALAPRLELIANKNILNVKREQTVQMRDTIRQAEKQWKVLVYNILGSDEDRQWYSLITNGKQMTRDRFECKHRFTISVIWYSVGTAPRRHIGGRRGRRARRSLSCQLAPVVCIMIYSPALHLTRSMRPRHISPGEINTKRVVSA
ncbi:hypothetical protein EVAR_30662_1 [Eumeta japonica]|uniref:Uncharacterized protein n=1 Tax=Eumeta variegata TaxID=151549 RepID=A0A4C1VTR7_EUMVA|nr:hypothetical protein EVAR_30662_1 [Eumeta japonica]